jgi:ribose transport system permease protein
MMLLKSKTLSRFFSNYGMFFVLLLLCLFFSWATMTEQHPEGVKAARLLARDLAKEKNQNKGVLILARQNRQDLQFAETLEKLLKEKGFSSVKMATGEPAEIRKKIGDILRNGETVDIMVTTRSYAPAAVRIKENFPELSSVKILTPSSYTWPTFLLPENLMNVANQIVVIAIIAVGMTMVIVSSGIDLSVGSLIALSAVVVTWLIRRAGGPTASPGTMILCALAAIVLCGSLGAFTGFMITRFKLPAFIATLGMMQVASGFAYIISRGKPIYEVPDSFVWLGRGIAPILSVPYAVIMMILIYLAAHILMTRTTLGRHIYAVGGNAEAARLSGVRVNAVLLFVYITCGVMAGLGGIVMASQLKSGAPTYGQMYELYVIASVVVGGASLSGGEGRIMGTLIGAFIIAVIQNGMNLTNVESYTQKVVLGFVILGAVLLDMLKKRGWRRRKKTP